MGISRPLHQRIVGRLEVLQALLNQKIQEEISIPDVKYRLRGTSAGKFNTATAVIDFNPILLQDNVEEYIRSTVAHEYAHHAVHELYGEVQFPHGREWQSIMSHFGVEPRVTHSYDVSRIRPVFTWECPCMQHQMSRNQHKELITGKHIYDCGACGQPLQRYVSA